MLRGLFLKTQRSIYIDMALNREIPFQPSLLNSPSLRTSLAVQWLKLCASTAGGTGSIPGRGTKIAHATWRDQKKKFFFPNNIKRKNHL